MHNDFLMTIEDIIIRDRSTYQRRSLFVTPLNKINFTSNDYLVRYF